MISRRHLAHALGQETASLARADRRGTGPGKPFFVSKTSAVYREEEVASYLRARGLEWIAGTVRPIEGPRAVENETRESAS